MRLPALDRINRLIALLLLLVSVWTGSHRQQDDSACLPSLAGEHDASKHAFAPLGAADHEHCAVCHWIRALKPTFASAVLATTVQTHGDQVAARPFLAHLAPSSGRLPARAPPART